MLRDRRRLRRMLGGGGGRGGRRGGGRGRPDPERARALIAESIERAERRRATLPTPSFPEELPVSQRRDEIAEAIEAHRVVVVCGETGSGKTTQLPKICLGLGRGVRGTIGHTQPRRIAARAVATRIAEELGRPLGSGVGYKVRFGDRTGADDHVKLMTDGVLLAETRADRWLEEYDTLIIDEAHERSLNIDFLLGYLRRVVERRPEFRLVITSATIDPERFSEHFGGAPIIEVSGRTYPVEVRYRPLASGDDEEERDVVAGILDAVDELARPSGAGGGDVLVFLPGEREIRETAEALRKHHPPETEILPLYARLSAEEQMRVFRGHRGRRIVLATNVAETSLTVPGIRGVVDPGLARISRYSPRQRVQRLPIEPVSRASADQRAGRCGRVGPGVCVRLYSEGDLAERAEFTDPEIVRTNLASVVLQMKSLGLGDVSDFPFIDPPDARLVGDGYETLHELGAIDDDGELTGVGRELARLPIDPRIGRMALGADREGALSEGLVIAAALSIQDPRERPADRRDAADEAHAAFAHERSDFLTYLNLWSWFQERKRHLSGAKLRKACKQNFLSYVRMREWEDTHRQLRRLVTELGYHPNTEPADEDAVHRALLTGLLTSIGRLKDNKEYAGPNGVRFSIFPGSGQFSARPKWVMAGQLVRTTRLYAHTVARIDPRWVETLAPHLVRKRHGSPLWDGASGRVVAEQRVALFGLEIVSGRMVDYGPIEPHEARRLFIHHALIEGEIRTKGKFLDRNRALIDRVEALEAKGRRRDLLADAESRYAFYDARIPPDVWSVSKFERWRKDAERGNPALLEMTESDILAGDASEITPERYPDERPVADSAAALRYKFEPGARDDGVTIEVGVADLPRIDDRDQQWLVPGMVEEKIVALIRALPKRLRTSLTPAPDVAAKVAATLGDGPHEGVGLLERVAEALGRLSGQRIGADAWREDALPEHLRMNVRVVDGAGEVLAEGRDLAAIRRELGATADAATRTVAHPDYQRTGARSWDFADLPERVAVDVGGRSVDAYPTLLPDAEGVSPRLLADRAEAGASLREGVARLLTIELGRDALSLVDHDASFARLCVLYAPVGEPKSLRADLGEMIVRDAALGDRTPARTRAEYDAALDAGWNGMRDAARRCLALVGSILEERQGVELALDGAPASWQRSVTDIDAQLDALFAPRFLVESPGRWLAQYPRYLRAVRTRVERIASGGRQSVVRDEAWIDELLPWMELLSERTRRNRESGLRDAELERFRWMLEEFRVSLFAQELGTVVKVSPERLRKQWEKTRA